MEESILRAAGEALYGGQWQSPLSRDLGVTDRTVETGSWGSTANRPTFPPASCRCSAPERIGSPTSSRSPSAFRTGNHMASTTIFETCQPRQDILNGTMSEAEFAARLGPVLSGQGPADYVDARRFFANTYPTAGLKELLGGARPAVGSRIVLRRVPPRHELRWR